MHSQTKTYVLDVSITNKHIPSPVIVSLVSSVITVRTGDPDMRMGPHNRVGGEYDPYAFGFKL